MTFLPGAGGKSLAKLYDDVSCYRSCLGDLPWCNSLFSALQVKSESTKAKKIFKRTSRRHCKTGVKVSDNTPVVQMNIPVQQSSEFIVYEEIPEELICFAAKNTPSFLMGEEKNAVS